MSKVTLEKGFRLVLGYLSTLKERKETDFKNLELSFDGLIKMCEKESFDRSAEELKTLKVRIVRQKKIIQRDINEFRSIMTKTLE